MAQTAYWVIAPTAGWSTPAAADIRLGTVSGGVVYGSETGFPTSGSGTINEATLVTALSAGTGYTVAWTVYDDVLLTYSDVEPGTFTTLGVNASASGSLAAITLTASTGAATGGAAATGTPAAITLTPATGVATGGADASSAVAPVTLTPATGAATGGAGASATPAPITLTAAAGTATGAAGGDANASGSIAAISLTAPTGSATGNASVSAGLAGINLTAPTGAASNATDATASGSLAALGLSAIAGVAAGSAEASGSLAYLGLTAPTGAASAAGGTASAAEVWNYVLSNGMTAGSAVVAIYDLLNELHLLHGLNSGFPLTVSSSARAAGIVSQLVEESAGVVTVTRQ